MSNQDWEKGFEYALSKAKIERLQAKLDMFYSLPTAPDWFIKELERELADLHRASK
jgi:hypothetical protein